MANFKDLKSNATKLNKSGLLDEKIKVVGISADDLETAFIEKIEEIDDAGELDSVPNAVYKFYETLVPDDDEEEDTDTDDDDQEEEEKKEKNRSTKKRGRKTSSKKSSKKKSKKGKCPAGGEFGADVNEFGEECDDCDYWEDCVEANQDLDDDDDDDDQEEEKKSKKKKKSRRNRK